MKLEGSKQVVQEMMQGFGLSKSLYFINFLHSECFYYLRSMGFYLFEGFTC